MKKLSLVLAVCCLLFNFVPIANVSATNARDLILDSFSPNQIVERFGPIFREDYRRTRILASVSMAQFILESGWGKSELAQNANNLFGMKFRLSGVDWTGKRYTKATQEYENGKYVTITADFRAYESIEDSIKDHSTYLLSSEIAPGKKRYAGLQGCEDYREAVSIIKRGGYATSPTYVDNVCRIIEKYGLTKFDVGGHAEISPIKPKSKRVNSMGYESTTEGCPFLVKVKSEDLYIASGPSEESLTDVVTHTGAFTIVEMSSNGWGRLKSGAGWIKLDGLEKIQAVGSGVRVVSEPYDRTSFDVGGHAEILDIKPQAKRANGIGYESMTEGCPFLVRVKSEDLHIASGPSEESLTGMVTHAGAFTIVEMSSNGWGRLKSGAGWIKLDGLERR